MADLRNGRSRFTARAWSALNLSRRSLALSTGAVFAAESDPEACSESGSSAACSAVCGIWSV